MTAGRRLPHPAFLPAIALPSLPWAERHVRQLAGQHHMILQDLWDEAVSALIRAALHYDPRAGVAFSTYACHAVLRACWRLIDPSHQARRHYVNTRRRIVPLDDHAQSLVTASAEAIVLAHEAVVSRACLDGVPSVCDPGTGVDAPAALEQRTAACPGAVGTAGARIMEPVPLTPTLLGDVPRKKGGKGGLRPSFLPPDISGAVESNGSKPSETSRRIRHARQA